MNQPTQSQPSFVASAHQLRRDYLATLFENALRSLGQALRTQHENSLRQAGRVMPRFKSTIGTPA